MFHPHSFVGRGAACQAILRRAAWRGRMDIWGKKKQAAARDPTGRGIGSADRGAHTRRLHDGRF
jgi:hypothetical protein